MSTGGISSESMYEWLAARVIAVGLEIATYENIQQCRHIAEVGDFISFTSN
jgi:2-keto-3-deoxy-6-phosphogluconate aldolase